MQFHRWLPPEQIIKQRAKKQPCASVTLQKPNSSRKFLLSNCVQPQTYMICIAFNKVPNVCMCEIIFLWYAQASICRWVHAVEEHLNMLAERKQIRDKGCNCWKNIYILITLGAEAVNMPEACRAIKEKEMIGKESKENFCLHTKTFRRRLAAVWI